jgi:hypothetical protein
MRLYEEALLRPQLFIRTADVTASLTWPDGTPDAAEKMVWSISPPRMYALC